MLPAKYVIHTVGAVWSGGNNKEDDLLKNVYLNSLKIAAAKGIRSIAFPNISTGIFHFPKERAAAIAVDTIKEFIKTNSSIEKILFVCYDEENYQLYQSKIRAE